MDVIYRIEIDTSNDAFQSNDLGNLTEQEAASIEMARMLHALATEIYQQSRLVDRKLHDDNGNSCGLVKVLSYAEVRAERGKNGD